MFGAGTVSGVFYAGNRVQFFKSDGSIRANITCGSVSSTREGDYGGLGYAQPVS